MFIFVVQTVIRNRLNTLYKICTILTLICRVLGFGSTFLSTIYEFRLQILL